MNNLETERLILRPWRESDADALFKYAQDPEVGPRAGWPPHKSVKESLEIIRTVFSGPTMWAVELRETHEAIGCVGYLPAENSNLNIPSDQCEVGYWIGKPYWGHGICTEAMKAVVDYCFNEKGYTVLWGDFFPENPASGKVMEKLGFKDTGRTAICPNLEVGSDRPVKVMKLDRLLIRLRPFERADAPTILSWCKDKYSFRLWSADRYADYPATPEQMLRQYDSENKFPLTMIEKSKVSGHILLRYPSSDRSVVRFGFVIIDNSLRGQGYGKKLLALAIDYARNKLGAEKVTLGVFEDNISALECYKSVGFRITGNGNYMIDSEEWKGFEMEMDL